MASQVRCLGGARDGVLISEVREFLETMGKNPLRQQAPLQQVLDIHSRLAASGHNSTGNYGHDDTEGNLFLPASMSGMSHRDLRSGVQDARVASLVLDLPPVMQEAVSQAMDDKGHVQALPMTLGLDRKLRKGKNASSTVRDALAKWFESPEGKKWKEERDAIFGSDAKSTTASA